MSKKITSAMAEELVKSNRRVAREELFRLLLDHTEWLMSNQTKGARMVLHFAAIFDYDLSKHDISKASFFGCVFVNSKIGELNKRSAKFNRCFFRQEVSVPKKESSVCCLRV